MFSEAEKSWGETFVSTFRPEHWEEAALARAQCDHGGRGLLT